MRTCRFCSSPLEQTFIDLGKSPLSNAFLRGEDLPKPELFFPLHAFVCEKCFLVQLEEFESPATIFDNYAYFSSYSESWLNHAKNYVRLMIERFHLRTQSQVVELASNDGYLLQYFQRVGVQVLGIEPAQNVAQVALEKGIPTRVEFFGTALAQTLREEGIAADLIAANNVLAHVPNLNDFVAGIRMLLKPTGVCTVEFPHLLNLIQQNQFDTIYHEHFSYFSFLTVSQVFAAQGLTVFDVEEIPTHGGSLRIYAKHAENNKFSLSERVEALSTKEINRGLNTLAGYRGFGARAAAIKFELVNCLRKLKAQGKSICAYGAPAKGNTLLNYCGIGKELIDYTVDRNPHKQGLFLPGTHLPIYAPEQLQLTRPDYVLLLPWNLKDELMAQLAFIRVWGGQFILPIPHVAIIP